MTAAAPASAAPALSLRELNGRIAAALAAAPGLAGVWVTAETSDVRVSGGHCYMELIEKDPASGAAVARARATVWASRYARIDAEFRGATGSPLVSGIRVMLRADVSYHPVYGLSLNITAVNPAYTLGDLLRRRREMLARLEAEGILNLNRSLPMPADARRVAVVSARGAAGYGDFIAQLYTNRYRLRFHTRLYESAMQGEGAPAGIIAALEAIAASGEDYDCVVIIRGGGATGDLAAFDNYALAANIAMFPLPVIIGIGHERDVTLLDYVAHLRVKTPTAAAEWLIGRGAACLERLHALGRDILDAAVAAMAARHRRLEYIAGQLPALASGVLSRAAALTGPRMAADIADSAARVIARGRERLDSLDALAAALSPAATLRRGFSITRARGRAVADASELVPGDVITSVFACGEVRSTVLNPENDDIPPYNDAR